MPELHKLDWGIHQKSVQLSSIEENTELQSPVFNGHSKEDIRKYFQDW